MGSGMECEVVNRKTTLRLPNKATSKLGNKTPTKTRNTYVQNPFYGLSIMKLVRWKITQAINADVHRANRKATNKKTTLSLPNMDPLKTG